MTELKDPQSCYHGATSRVTGTRNLWRCLQCGGVLEDNLKLVEPVILGENTANRPQ